MVKLYPAGFDQTYFSADDWSDRVDRWIAKHRAGFSGGNAKVVRDVLRDLETGLRMVVNITAFSLHIVLRDNAYKNLYDRPAIGGRPREPSPMRKRVDDALGLGPRTYFGAAALGGAGVRYYGEYCLVLSLDQVEGRARLLDRDSFDIELEPFRSLPLTEDRLRALRGDWDTDRVDMAVLRVLLELGHDLRLVTSGTVSDTVLRDQEFIEVHLDGSFAPRSVEEVRESPDETAIETSLRNCRDRGTPLDQVDQEWLQRRDWIGDQLARYGLRHRIVTLHGRGYQWK
ncbi:hypothetical protein FB561_4229 [Kribbella amoyensis]|uniref:Uncharacterized protein n=1 Tax=Kribbella amoyensis TaxID=996641 RepID=A0A561BW00_9ACTN|nr:hypothetical protein [Kribbella amoyensis]TWD83074.1 hypothetical protein FB561_4229 [Kribbella amoyensis]